MTATTQAGQAGPSRRIRLSVPRAFGAIGHTPHRGQLPVYRSRARNKVFAGGRRVGKSNVGGMTLYLEALRTRPMVPALFDSGHRREYWIVGPSYQDAEKEFRVLYDALKRRDAPFDYPGTYVTSKDGDMQLSLYGGRYLVKTRSAERPHLLVGEGLSGVIMAEAAKQKERTWTKFIRPTLADFKGWALFSSTPEGKNWMYRLWLRGQSADEPDWDSWRIPSWRNQHVYPEGATPEGLAEIRRRWAERRGMHGVEGVDPEILALAADLSAENFNQEVACLFTEYVGRVFKDFDEETHVRDLHWNPAWPSYGAVDYGFTNPFVWLLVQVDEFGNIYVVDEHYAAGETIDESARAILDKGLCPPNTRMFYPDPSSPGDTRVLERYLKVRHGSGTGGELKDRLRLIRAALRPTLPHLPDGHPEKRPKLLVARRCVETIREFGDYRYPKTAEEAAELGREVPESPMKKDDHAPEALGRFFIGHFGSPLDQRGGGRTTIADLDSE